jgi:hypothetical protein
MYFYPSKNNNRLNRIPFTPECMTGSVKRVMLNPHYPVTTAKGTKKIFDSGAFQELDMKDRLTPKQALARQLSMNDLVRFRSEDYDNHAEAFITYDMLVGVDEALIDVRTGEPIVAPVELYLKWGWKPEEIKRVKRRGSEELARPAVAATLESAAYYASQRQRIPGAIAFAAQGATPDQYVNECVIPMFDVMQPGDWFAFGGFCIIGMQPSLKPLFMETVSRVLPLLVKKGIARAHVLGVCVADMVKYAADQGRKHGVVMSTDSSSIEINSIMGKVWNDGKWMKVYEKEQKYVDYWPTPLAHENIKRFSEWSASL